MPYYVQGETSVEDFRNQIETYKDVPFMEFKNDLVIATIRMDRAKDIFLNGNQVDVFMNNATRTVRLSNEIHGINKDYGGMATKSNQRMHIMNPEWGVGMLFATDYFIGLHSATNKDRIIFSNPESYEDWGLLHEIGHTYQVTEYTWSGMTEVTVNIYSDYARNYWSSWSMSAFDADYWTKNDRNAVRDYFARLEADPTWTFDRNTAETNNYHSAALGFFVNLRRAFGNDFYPVLNQSYRTLSASELPKSDDEKKAMFVILTSKAANRNLLPYFDAWRFTVSAETRAKVEALNLPTLEKEIWKDLLATSEEEAAGTYRIDSVQPYSVPNVTPSSEMQTVKFEQSRYVDFSGHNFYSEPYASKVTVEERPLEVNKEFYFGPTEVDVYVKNDFNVSNILKVPLNVTPGNGIVFSGQHGRYAVMGYDKETKQIIAQGNSKKILTNIPNTIYPYIRIIDQSGQNILKEAIGYGSTYGVDFAASLNETPVVEGDIVEVYHRQSASRVTRYMNDEMIPTTKETNYYQIMPEGWREIEFNTTAITAEDITTINGHNGEIAVTTLPANSVLPSSINYKVADESIIEVDANGNYTALKIGTTIIDVEATYPVNIGSGQTKTVKKTINVNVETGGLPVIDVSKYTEINKNDTFDIMDNVNVSDLEDTDLNIETTGNVDPNVAGVYKVKYTTTDSDNNTTNLDRVVVVKDDTIGIGSQFIIQASSYSVGVEELDASDETIKQESKVKVYSKTTGDLVEEDITITRTNPDFINGAVVGVYDVNLKVSNDINASVDIKVNVETRIFDIDSLDTIKYEVNTNITSDQFITDITILNNNIKEVNSDFEQNVDLSKVGVYKVNISATDNLNNNSRPKEIIVIVMDKNNSVYDETLNELVNVYPFSVNFNELNNIDLVLKSKVTGWSTLTGEVLNLTLKSEIPTTVGNHVVTFITDNNVEITTNVTVVAPTIKITSTNTSAKFLVDFVPSNDDLVKAYGISATASYPTQKTRLANTNLTIDFDTSKVNFNKAGKYQISVTAVDNASKTSVSQGLEYVVYKDNKTDGNTNSNNSANSNNNSNKNTNKNTNGNGNSSNIDSLNSTSLPETGMNNIYNAIIVLGFLISSVLFMQVRNQKNL